MSNDLSKQEYLKRYLENDKDSERKRKKKLKTGKVKTNVPRLKIVDQDIDLKSINFDAKDVDEDDEEAPVVAEVIDERPIEEKLKELYESSRWKKLDTGATSPHYSAAISDDRNFKSSHDSPSKHSSSERGGTYTNKLDSKIRHDSESDTSPSRTEKLISKNRRHDSDSDFSPPRHKTHNSRRNDSDTDIPRKHQKTVNESRRLDSDSDISPPRQGVLNKSKRHNSDSDISPPRRDSSKRTQNKYKDRRRDSDCDISPPRDRAVNKSKNQKENLYKRHDSGSQEVGYNKKSSLGQLKSNRKRNESQRNSDSDMSPPRSSSARDTFEGKGKKLDKTLSGLKAGLQVSKALQKEVQEMRKKEKSHLSLLDDDISGRNAETIVRDRRTGLKRDLNKEQEAKAKKEEKVRKYEEKYNKWGKGVEQTEEKMEKVKDEAYEMSKPLARYKDDEDLDERLKSIIREDDPMAEYIKKKKQKNVPDFPVYSGPAPPPNRFGIPPGYRWDGLDRSNGFEKKYFEKINATKAVQDEAYLWSVQDM